MDMKIEFLTSYYDTAQNAFWAKQAELVLDVGRIADYKNSSLLAIKLRQWAHTLLSPEHGMFTSTP